MMKQSEHIYRSLLQTLPDIVYEVSTNGIFTYLNDAIVKIGFTPDELIGSHFSTIIHDDDIENVQRDIVLSRMEGKKFGDNNSPRLFDERRTGKRFTKLLRVRLKQKEGCENNYYAVKHPIVEVVSIGLYDYKNGGKPQFKGTIGIMRDVSHDNRSMKMVLQTENHYRLLLENSSDIITILANDGTILFKSHSNEKLLGYPQVELIGECELDYIHEDDVPSFDSILKEEKKLTPGETELEYRYRHRGGEWRMLHTALRRITGDGDATRCFILNSRDVTEHNEAEKRFKLIEENVTDLFWIRDLDFVPIYMSPSVKKMRGYTLEEAMQQRMEDFVTPDSMKMLKDVFMHEMELERSGSGDPNRSTTFEVEYIHKNGSHRWFEVKASFLRNEKGDAVGLVGVDRDITERKEMEKSLRDSQRKEMRNALNLAFLSRAAMELVEITPEENIYDFISWKVRELAGNAIVIILSYDVSAKTITIESFSGPKGTSDYIISITNGNPVGLRTQIQEAEMLHRAGNPELHQVKGGLEELTLGAIPKDVSAKFSAHFNLGESYSISLVSKGELQGIVGIMLPKDVPLTSREILETLINQSAIVLQRKKAIDALQESEERYRNLVQNAGDIIFGTDVNGYVTFVNPVAQRIIGYTNEDIIGKPFVDMIRPDYQEGARRFFGLQIVRRIDNTYYEYPVVAQDGREVWLGQNTQLVYEGERVQGYQAVARDITELKNIQEKLMYLSTHDYLTELPNRALFQEKLSFVLASAKRRKDLAGVLFLDLDGFKAVNDTHGHDIGDMLLKSVARRLVDCVREVDIVSRMGGDEFTIILESVQNLQEMVAVAKRIIVSIANPYMLGENEVHLTVSVGIAVFPTDGITGDVLLKKADDAMYRAKDKGKNNYHFYSDPF